MQNRLTNFASRLTLWIKTFPISLAFGLLIGILLALFFDRLNEFVAGVVLGVILEELIKSLSGAIKEWRKTHPLHKLLGSIAEGEDCYIYFSSFFRDLEREDEFKLLRLNPNKSGPDVEVKGPDFLLGEGDALALALILSLLSRIPIKPNRISVERGDLVGKRWGVNCFCIGAHNLSTREVLTKFKNNFYIFDNNYTVITKPSLQPEERSQNGQEIRKGVYITSQFDTEPIDYGIILKFKDQFHSDKKVVFIIAGIGPAGTSGAAFYLLSHYAELSNLGEEFGVLIQVPSGYQSAVQVKFEDEAQYYIKS